jgi:hypothetical protein
VSNFCAAQSAGRSVKEVAAAFGFAGAAHFNTVFSKQFGYRPGEARRGAAGRDVENALDSDMTPRRGCGTLSPDCHGVEDGSAARTGEPASFPNVRFAPRSGHSTTDSISAELLSVNDWLHFR